MVKVKICGITNLDDALAAVEFGADMLGFNFYAASSRYLTPENAAAIAGRIPHGVLKIGVFVNSTDDDIAEIANEVGLDVVQLHGDEDDNFIRMIGHVTEKPVIKAFHVTPSISIESLVLSDADAVLLDAANNGQYGGTGKTFAWNLIDGVSSKKQLFLAGGLTPDNVAEAIHAARPYAVDVASGVESHPGIKDRKKVKAFIENAKNA